MKREILYDGKIYKIKYTHVRKRGLFGEILQKGGKTIAFISDKEKHFKIQATADCSKKDNYNKKFGRELAEERLLKLLKLYCGE